MGGFTYETRKKLTEQRILEAKAAGKDLTGMEKKLLPDPYYSVKTEPLQWMTSLLENGEAGTLSEIYKRELPGLVRVCVPEGQEEEFYYALDQMNQFQMTAGWYRRSLRTKEYIPFVRQSVSLYGGRIPSLNFIRPVWQRSRRGRRIRRSMTMPGRKAGPMPGYWRPRSTWEGRRRSVQFGRSCTEKIIRQC